jgi:hypothetical protein
MLAALPFTTMTQIPSPNILIEPNYINFCFYIIHSALIAVTVIMENLASGTFALLAFNLSSR